MKKLLLCLQFTICLSAYSQVQLVSGGSANAYTLSFPGVFSYSNGISVTFKANFGNTGAATINVNSLGAKTLKKQANADIASGDILSGQVVTLVYDGTNFQVTSALGSSGGGGGSDAQTLSISNDTLSILNGNYVVLPGGASSGWNITGNAGTDTATNFIGTTDSTGFIIKVDGIARGILTPEGDVSFGTSNTIGGNGGGDPTYATVSGGYGNGATFKYSTIGGGSLNVTFDEGATIAGGRYNSARSSATVGGGYDNHADGYYSVVAGGVSNNSLGGASFIGGGYNNTASGGYTTIAGGSSNNAGGYFSTIAGGASNSTQGDYSAVGGGVGNFASSFGEFVVGIYGTADPAYSTTGFDPNDRIFSVSNGADDTTRSTALTLLKSGYMGLGNTTPTATLHVDGTMRYRVNGASPPANYVLTSDDEGNATWQAGGGAGSDGQTLSISNDTLSIYNGNFVVLPGGGSGGWNLTGNSIGLSDFLGTTNAQALKFKVNNVPAGLIDESDNVGLGRNSLESNTGVGNVGIGGGAMGNSNSGNFNVAIGLASNNSGNQGDHNTSIGYGSLRGNNTGKQNTAIGAASLFYNTNGSNNTALGFNSLSANTTGSSNVAIGAGTLSSNTGQNNLVAVGDSALNSNTIGAENTAIGSKALEGNMAGSQNTALGFHALSTSQYDSKNTAVGWYSMANSTTGSWNTSLGSDALYNNMGNGNVAVGQASMLLNSSGSNNVAVGQSSLLINTTGDNNVAIGNNSMFNNNDGYGNTAVGKEAMLANTSGTGNVAMGYQTFKASTVGSNNTAVGTYALQLSEDGGSNAALGYEALGSVTTGSYNTGVGHGANVSVGTLNNATAIGANALATADNMVMLGDGAVTYVGSSGQNFITSDARFKQNVSSSNVAGLDFISKLRPVQYNLQARALDIFRRGGSTKSIEKTDYSKAESMLRTGFIAQEVEQAAHETHFNFDGIHVPENDKDFYSISYSSLVVPLVKAVQELNQKVEVLESENARLRGANTAPPVTKESAVSKGEGTPVLTEQQRTINQLTLVNGATRAKLAELQQQLDEMKKILGDIKRKD